MECTYCRKWHSFGIKNCNAPGAPKTPEVPKAE